MKRLSFALLLLPFVAFGQEHIPFPSFCDLPAFTLDGQYIDVAPVHFRFPPVENDTLKYRELDLSFTYLYPFNGANAITLGMGYVGTEVKWKENPFFRATEFSYVTFTLTGLTLWIDNWLWKVGETVLVDGAELDFSDFALYQTFLLGKYALCDPLYFNVGFILELGLNKSKIWPVLGFDYIYSDSLQFHAVYPLDMSVEYYLLEKLSIEGSIRILRNRHRVKNTEPLPMGIFEYRTAGAEFDVNFYPTAGFMITGFIGSTYNGGDFKITDRNNHNARHFKFGSSLYGGALANLTF